MAVLVAGTVASQVGAGAAVAAQPAAPAPAVNTAAMPVPVQQALQVQLQKLVADQHTSAGTHQAAAKPAAAPAKVATAGTKSAGFKYSDASYIMTLRSAGIEYVDNIPRELQQDQGFNPLAGCLPMFLQIPIFISLFHVLRHIANSASVCKPYNGNFSDYSGQLLKLYTFTPTTFGA